MKSRVEPIWRKAYEVPAAVGWFAAGGIMMLAAVQSGDLGVYPAGVAAICFFFAFMRLSQALILWEKKARLVHLPAYEMSGDEIMNVVKKARKLAKRGKLRVDE